MLVSFRPIGPWWLLAALLLWLHDHSLLPFLRPFSPLPLLSACLLAFPLLPQHRLLLFRPVPPTSSSVLCLLVCLPPPSLAALAPVNGRWSSCHPFLPVLSFPPSPSPLCGLYLETRLWCLVLLPFAFDRVLGDSGSLFIAGPPLSVLPLAFVLGLTFWAPDWGYFLALCCGCPPPLAAWLRLGLRHVLTSRSRPRLRVFISLSIVLGVALRSLQSLLLRAASLGAIGSS